MSAFNGGGTFVISGSGLPYVTGTTISSTVANQLNTDLATGLSTCITKDGQTTTTGLVPFGDFGISTSLVKFPATQVPSSDPNTLDDYEEGTWTPADGSGAGLTFTNVSARYTKIGNMVFAGAQLTYPLNADASHASINGFPFPVVNATYVRAPCVILANTSASFPLAGTMTANTASMSIQNGFNVADVANSVLSGCVVVFQMAYRVT